MEACSPAWECYFTHPLHLRRSFCQRCEKNSLTLQAIFFSFFFSVQQCKSSKLKRHLFNKTHLRRERERERESCFQGCPNLDMILVFEGSAARCRLTWGCCPFKAALAISCKIRRNHKPISQFSLCLHSVCCYLFQTQAPLWYVSYLVSDSCLSSLTSSNGMRGAKYFQRHSIPSSSWKTLHSLSKLPHECDSLVKSHCGLAF